MAQDNANRQRRLNKQKAKRKEKRQELNRRSASSHDLLLAKAAEWPIIEALEAEELWQTGMGHVILARKMPNGRTAWASFLVDVWCLGIKNVMCQIDSSSEYTSVRQKLTEAQSVRSITPERLAKIVRGAVAYSGALGFRPPSDFSDAEAMLAGIDPTACPDPLDFGKNGKPFYMRGPYENSARAAAIVAKVIAAGGHFTLPFGDAEAPQGAIGGNPVWSDELDDDEDDPRS